MVLGRNWGFRLSVIRYQLWVIGYPLSVIGYPLSVICYRLSVICYLFSEYEMNKNPGFRMESKIL
jgi:hypothetical protein